MMLENVRDVRVRLIELLEPRLQILEIIVDAGLAKTLHDPVLLEVYAPTPASTPTRRH